MRDLVPLLLVLTAVIAAALIGTKVGKESVPLCPPLEPEVQIVFIYMMEVPWQDSDFRGLLHEFTSDF